MLLTLARDNSGRCVGLHLPATLTEINRVYAELDKVSMDADKTRILRADTGVGSLDRWLREHKMEQPTVITELNALAEKLDAMTEQELKTFDGALAGAAYESIDDVLRIADSLGDYIFIHGVTTEKELGRFLVDTGYKGFPEDVVPYLDFAAIGIEYHAEHDGAFTGSGYTLRKSSAEPFLLPREQTELFRVYLQTQGMRELGLPPRMLRLPASDQETREMKSRLNIEDFVEAAIVSVSCMDDALAKVLPQDLLDVNLLDQFADQYANAASDGEREKCLAVLEIEKPSTLDAAVSLLNGLEHYTLLPDDAEAYGKEALTRAGATEELLAELDGFMDYEAYGTYMMEADGVRITDYGLLRREGNPFPDMDMGIQMIRSYTTLRQNAIIHFGIFSAMPRRRP